MAGSTDQDVDATRRTRLAVERTYLAWWRTGLTAYAVALAAGKLVPELTDTGVDWAYLVLGAALAALGSAVIVYGWRRQRTVDRSLDDGEYAPADSRVVAAVALAGAALGIALTVLLLTGL